MQNVRLDEAQAGNKIAGRNIINLRYADDTTLIAESEELKSHLMKVKEECEKVGLKLNIQKSKIMASDIITSWKIDGETMETVTDFIFLLPWWLRRLSVCLQCRRPGFNPWVRKIPWRKKWQPTPVRLPGKFHGRMSLVGYIVHGVAKRQTRLSNFTYFLGLQNHCRW